MSEKNLLIGIDVGGTNTDSVLLDPSKFASETRGVISYHKSSTTADVSGGISDALDHLSVEKNGYTPDNVLAVTIGTTHFINAVVEQDRARLAPVAVIRLCGPYSQGSGPFSDFPAGLTKIIKGYTAFVDGGHRVDGNEIQPLDEASILEHAAKIKSLGIKSVAIVGIFSIINKTHEQRAAELVRSVIPDGDIVMSHTVSRIGLIPRENASILNASVMSFAGKIIRSFIRSVRSKGFKCPIMLTQNDGTVLTVSEALQTPIRTFSSGATNSMRGAAFLCAQEGDIHGKTIVVVDIGGTTTDVGLLLPSGYPRQSMSYSEVGGVRVNFSMPQVESIGLGGGSIVRESKGEITVGPDSVGADIKQRALVFGGDTVTSTDVTVAITEEKSVFDLGDKSEVQNLFSDSYKTKFQQAVKTKLERVIDTIRTSPEPLPVLLVGGGSFISPTTLDGASSVHRPPYYQVANAIGAALGKLSASLQKIEVLDSIADKDAVIEKMKKEVTADIVAKGAVEDSIDIVELSYDPVPYVDRTYTFEIKVVGDIDFDKVSDTLEELESANKSDFIDSTEAEQNDTFHKNSSYADKDVSHADQVIVDYQAYKPFINGQREWIISETDLEFIRIGTYILGCGGGGTPYPIFLEMRNMLRDGAKVRVINLHDAPRYAKGEGKFITVGFAGSPTVADEQLQGHELSDAAKAMFEYLDSKPDGVFPLEIGGGNGFKGMYCGASSQLDIPVIDADLMGRAYPTHAQILPCALKDDLYLKTTSVSDGNGNDFLITGAQSDLYVEKMMRAALAEIGAHVGVVNVPMTSTDLVNYTVHHSLSTAWRIGRAVRIARQKFEIEKLPERIIESVGGPVTGRKIFAGKIVGIEKKLFKGHVYGEVMIENEEKDKMVIPFKNENIVAKVQKSGSETWETVCSVPDLISVCDADNGEAVGTPEYRYGIMVFVLAFSPSDLWISTQKAMDTGGPKFFGPAFEDVEYKPVGKYVAPVSVIDEFGN
ncbi:Hydantoin utilization protein A [Meyerozyma sp. JA9]|nr:Hydantoin utilization protein A [Meyerozyma sp. JA9]